MKYRPFMSWRAAKESNPLFEFWRLVGRHDSAAHGVSLCAPYGDRTHLRAVDSGVATPVASRSNHSRPRQESNLRRTGLGDRCRSARPRGHRGGVRGSHPSETDSQSALVTRRATPPCVRNVRHPRSESNRHRPLERRRSGPLDDGGRRGRRGRSSSPECGSRESSDETSALTIRLSAHEGGPSRTRRGGPGAGTGILSGACWAFGAGRRRSESRSRARAIESGSRCATSLSSESGAPARAGGKIRAGPSGDAVGCPLEAGCVAVTRLPVKSGRPESPRWSGCGHRHLHACRASQGGRARSPRPESNRHVLVTSEVARPSSVVGEERGTVRVNKPPSVCSFTRRVPYR